MKSDLPLVNQKIKYLIDEMFDGNVTAFSKKLGYQSPQKVNRLFNIDSRIGKYPKPSIQMIQDISSNFEISTDWFLDHGNTNPLNKISNSGIGNVNNTGLIGGRVNTGINHLKNSSNESDLLHKIEMLEKENKHKDELLLLKDEQLKYKDEIIALLKSKIPE